MDAVQAQIARTMLTTGDWVTARLDGIAYLEKPPLIYWMMAVSYKVFGVHDWAARIPVALFCIGSGLADGWVRHVGLWPQSRLLRRAGDGHLRGPVPVYAHPDSRRDPDLHHHAGDVGAAARHRRRRAASARLGVGAGRQPGNRAAAEEPDWGALPGRRRRYLPVPDQAIVFARRPGSGCIPSAGWRSFC